MKYRTIQLQQYRYHLKPWGRDSSPPLIFLHGFMGSVEDFNEVMESLSSHYYCIGVDLPGHGKTETQGDESGYRMEAIASSLIHLIEMLGLASVHLLGYSMGGRLALYLAIHYPTYFQSVILESASPGLATEKQRLDRLQRDHAIAQRIEQQDFTDFLDWWYSAALFQSLRQHPAYEKMRARRQQNNPAELARSLRQLSTGRQPSLWETLATLSIPGLWLVGNLDRKFVRISQQVHNLQPSLSLQVLPAVGHNTHVEAPDLWVKVVHQFIKKNSMSL